MKGRSKRWKENLTAALEVPGDIAYQEPIITLTGTCQAVIENYRSILCYTTEEIIVLTLRGKVIIQGKCLEIPCYTPCEMQIKGRIREIHMER